MNGNECTVWHRRYPASFLVFVRCRRAALAASPLPSPLSGDLSTPFSSIYDYITYHPFFLSLFARLACLLCISVSLVLFVLSSLSLSAPYPLSPSPYPYPYPLLSDQPGAVPLKSINTPLAQMLHKHIVQQCEPFTIQYQNALELGATQHHLLTRRERVGFCMNLIMKKLNSKCSNRVLNYQNALSALAESETKENLEAFQEAEGRLQFCARYPHKIDRDAINPTPVQWYFKNKDEQ